jgi:hypothetical protein
MFLTAAASSWPKPYLAGTSVVWATLIRMAGGSAAGLLLWAAHPRRGNFSALSGRARISGF